MKYSHLKIAINMNWEEAHKELGINNHSDWKKAYRDAARKHHPDLGGNEEKFKRIARAGEIFQEHQNTGVKPDIAGKSKPSAARSDHYRKRQQDAVNKQRQKDRAKLGPSLAETAYRSGALSGSLGAAFGASDTRKQRMLRNAGVGSLAGYAAGAASGKGTKGRAVGHLIGGALGALHGKMTHKNSKRAITPHDALNEYKRRKRGKYGFGDTVDNSTGYMVAHSLGSLRSPVKGLAGIGGSLVANHGVGKLQDRLQQDRFKGHSDRDLRNLVSKSKRKTKEFDRLSRKGR